MSATGYTKPLPTLTGLNRPFWDAAKRHELRLQRCTGCGHVRYPISPVCPRCLAPGGEWARLSGRGEVFSWVRYHRAFNRAFVDDVPYNVILVALDEGPHVFSNLVGIPDDEIEIGMPVEVVFDDVTDEIAIPRFRPATSRKGASDAA